MTMLKRAIIRFLNWGERYARTDTRYLAKSGFWLSVNNGFQTLAKLVLVVAFANLLTPESYGTYRFVLSVMAIVTVFSLTGMPSAVTQAVARGYEGALKSGLRVYLKWSTLILLVSGAISAYYFYNDNTTLGLSILIAGAFSPFFETFKLYDNFLGGKKAFKESFILSVPRKLVPLISLLITLFLTDNPIILVTVFFASNTVVILWAYYKTIQWFSPNTETDPKTVNFSKHLSFVNALVRVAANLDKVLIFHYLGTVELAIYSFAMAPQSQLSTLTSPLKTLAFPKLSQQSFETLQKTLPRKLALLSVPLIAIVGLYILAAPFLFSLLLPQYMDSVIYSQVLSLILLLMPLAIIKQIYSAHLRKKEIYIIGPVSNVLQIISLFVLLPTMGIWGVVISLFVGRLSSGLLALFFFVRK